MHAVTTHALSGIVEVYCTLKHAWLRVKAHHHTSVVPQGLLGDARSFKLEYEKRITAGNDKNATGQDRQIAAAKAAELRAKIAPFFLRREKKDVLNQPDRCA